MSKNTKSNSINFEASEDLQTRFGREYYQVGSGAVLVRDSNGNWDKWGSDVDTDVDVEDMAEEMFEDEGKQAKFKQNRMKFKLALEKRVILKKIPRGSDAKDLLRRIKRGRNDLRAEHIARALGFNDEDALLKYGVRNPRFLKNIGKLMKSPVSTLRRALSPKGSQFIDDMMEDIGGDETADLLAYVTTFLA